MNARLRQEDGIGLVELVIALAILNVVVLSLFAAFNAGAFSLQRANRISTAETIADVQMERYRALLYGSIGLVASQLPGDSMHTSDPANAAAQLTVATCTTALPECLPTQTFSSSSTPPSPDGRTYRVDSYVSLVSSGAGTPGARDLKEVTVVVRRTDTNQVLARLSSAFDKSTGCIAGASPC